MAAFVARDAVGKSAVPFADLEQDSWVYDVVVELAAQGLFPSSMTHTRPYSRGAIANQLIVLEKSRPPLNEGQRILIARLRSEFAEELATSTESSDQRLPIRFGAGARPQGFYDEHGPSVTRIGVDGTLALAFHPSTVVRMRVRLDTEGERESQHHGRKWKDHFTGVMDNATIKYRHGRIEVLWGRDFVRWGPSRNDALLLSSESPPFDLLRISYQWRTLRLTYLTTRLDDRLVNGEVARRFFAGHRIAWSPHRKLTVAASEVIVYGGVGRNWELNYLNPIVPYYWEQINNNSDDNPLWNLEVSIRPTDNVELYGELMIDDFQIDFVSEPQQIGGLIGGRWAPRPLDGRLFLEGEYERINTFVYGQRREWNRYYHFRDNTGNVIPIGSELETDADRFALRGTGHISRHWDVDIRFLDTRRGEDHIETAQKPGEAVPKGIPFPSGTVQRTTQCAIGVLFQLGGNIMAHVDGGWVWRRNVDHIEGLDRDGGFIRLRLDAKFWQTLLLS